MSTVEALLRSGMARLKASGSESARLDAELLLGMAVGTERTALRAHPEAPVGTDAEATYAAALVRREAGEPVAYIRGLKEFHGVALGVDARALIPRPETETLVDLADAEVLRRLTAAPRPRGAPAMVLADVGTGCGTVAVALIVALRRRGADGDVEILATDISHEALDLARENAVGHGVADRVRFVEADLLPPGGGPYELVLANLPYVQSAAVAQLPIAASFEPRLALDGGPDGLALIRRLLDRLPDALGPDGVALLEIGGDQGEAIVVAVADRLPGWHCTVAPDLGGLPRVARVERPPSAAAFGGPE
ncbi:MAG: HemK/PrmC family methyltransferase [Chloroflexota bacterium]